MSRYIGIDLHKAKSFVPRLDRRGRVLEQRELAPCQRRVTTVFGAAAGGDAHRGGGDGQLDVAG